MLDNAKRKKIIALLTNGSSRRTAAKYVGCSPSTITRNAVADPIFAEQLAVAEHSAEVDALNSLRKAARQERYWRAAAWILERKNPEDFALRPPTVFTGEEVFQMISVIVEILNQDIPEENCQRAIEKIEQMIEAQRLEQTVPSFPKPPNPPPLIQNPLPAEHPAFEPTVVTTLTPIPTLDPFATSDFQD